MLPFSKTESIDNITSFVTAFAELSHFYRRLENLLEKIEWKCSHFSF